MPTITLDTPLRGLLGGATAKALAVELDLTTVRGLLRHYPRRYDVRGELTDLGRLRIGEDVTVQAEVVSARTIPMRGESARGRRRTRQEILVTDGRHRLRLTFFNQPFRVAKHAPGTTGYFAGKVGDFRGQRQLTNPQFRPDDDPDVERFAGRPVPIYPATAEVPTWVVERSVRQVLDVLGDVPDPMPEALREAHRLPDLRAALRAVHQPADDDERDAARTRLTWDEALVMQVALARLRAARSELPGTPRVGRADGLRAAFDAALPFALTAGQQAVGAELAADLEGEHPMYRLLQGEVGSGKTVVALRAMLQVVDTGGQAALLAPTEVLAGQHAHSLRRLLGPLGRAGELDGAETATRIELLTGSQGAAVRRRALAATADGSAGIVVGTHALIQEGVEFADLGLVVVDEQHRFGVEQRDALRAKGRQPPHVLVMTATPIPRTVAMTVYGDLETSVLRELPAGRSPISTTVVPVAEHPGWLDRAWARITEEVAAGRQAYVVCPRIGDEPTGRPDAGDGHPGPDEEPGDPPEADDEPARRPPLAVLDVLARLQEGPLAALRVEPLHGRQAAEVKDDVMRRFADGRIDVLVATTVVEVGVDVPAASVMVVLDAERFGLSQLHQLRGRVGRGAAPGLCLLVTEAPAGSPARERLDAVAATTDGFAVSELDLDVRREGDVLGAVQSGRASRLRLLSLRRHAGLIGQARTVAAELVAADPTLAAHPALAAEVALLTDDRAAYLDKA